MEIKGLILYRQAERPRCTCTESAENTNTGRKHMGRKTGKSRRDKEHEGHKTGRKYSKRKTGRKHRDTRQVESSESTERHKDTDR